MKKKCKCYKCNKKFDMLDEQLDFIISGIPTYGSKYDGEELEIRLCCECFDEVIDAINKNKKGD